MSNESASEGCLNWRSGTDLNPGLPSFKDLSGNTDPLLRSGVEGTACIPERRFARFS